MERLLSRRALIQAAGVAGAAVAAGPLARTATAWPGGTAAQPSAYTHEATLAQEWTVALYDVVMAEGLTPPAAARVYAYAAIAAYEALVPGMPRHRSLGGQLNELGALPRPPAGGRVDWPMAASAAYGRIATTLFARSGRAATHDTIRAVEADHLDRRRAAGVPQDVLDRSVAWGRSVGRAVGEWAGQDGHAASLACTYTPPDEPWAWRPTPPNFRTDAFEPCAGSVRPFVLTSGAEVEPRPIPHAYSEDPSSEFYRQALTVYETGLALTDEQRAIARFWTDNPLVSGLPAGHWMLISLDVERQEGLDLGHAAESRARLGIVLFDAFLSCWSIKYKLHLLRPVSYVRDHVPGASGWNTFVNSPPFPEYTSGHSVASTAAAAVMTDLHGHLAFTSHTRATGNLPARHYESFYAAADEAAISRLYGGIHYPMGIEEGVLHGDQVGRTVLARLHTRRAR
ncbi:MAG TPA: vanadium-dependent haloperoxidase [Mycobacteriales bacterium]|nr:vanadium-dependent haloperoxidase [Mycobacteriales bacterium]